MESQLQVNFKVSCTSGPTVLRRLNFERNSDLTYSSLYSRLSSLFELDNFNIRYADEEGDLINIDNDKELKEAIDHALNQNKNKARVVIRLSLKKTDTQVFNQKDELPNVPSVNSNDNNNLAAGDQSSVPQIDNLKSSSESDTNNEEFPFERALNTGIKNFQDMIQTFVTQLSTTMEQENLNVFQPYQPNNGDNSRNVNSNDSSITNSSFETRQIPKVEASTSSEPVVHYGVLCDCCKNTIRGMRWKCTACSNYDLCQVCKSKSPSIHRHPNSHGFRPIPYPKTSNHAFPSENLHSATCDFCESVIFGIRHKCINCPDFDLCSNCISLAPTQHPNHTFMPIHRPGEPEIKILDAAFHPGIRCDGCQKQINGIRFKCGNCSDFDLCGNCEASPLNKHDLNHVFIKFKRPVPSPISSNTPLLPLFYSRTDTKICRPKECRQKSLSKEIESTTDNCIVEAQSPPIPTISGDTVFSRAPINLYEPLRTISPKTQSQNDSLSSAPSSCSVLSAQSQVSLSETSSTPSPSVSITTPKKLATEPVTQNLMLNSCFTEDVNVPDGTVLVPQAQFLKIWKMSNNGSIAWPESTVLQFVGGQRMFNDALIKPGEESVVPKIHVGSVEVGKTVCISADLEAPSEPGKYVSFWRLTDNEGNRFGHKIWCDIRVEVADQSSDMSASSMIFPVLNYDQQSVSARSNDTSIAVSSTTTTLASSEIEGFRNEDDEPVSPESSIEALKYKKLETAFGIESQSELYESDEESNDDDSSVSSDTSQDFIVIEKDSDDMQMQRGRSAQPYNINQHLSEGKIVDEVEPLAENVQSLLSLASSVEDDARSQLDVNDETQHKLFRLSEMGLNDKKRNLELLKEHNGDLQKVIDHLMNF